MIYGFPIIWYPFGKGKIVRRPGGGPPKFVRKGKMSMDEDQNYYDQFQEAYDCHLCHGAPIDRSENRNSVLCKNCREKAIRYPVPKKIWAAVAVVLVLLLVSMVRFPKTLGDYRIYVSAEDRIENGELYEGMTDLLNIVEKYPQSTALTGKLVRLAMKYGCYDYAAYTIDNYLVGKEVNDNLYYEVSNAMDILDRYYNTMDTMQKMGEELSPTLSVEETAETLKKQCLDLVNDKTQDPALLYYYASLFTQNSQEQRTYLENAAEYNPMLFDAHVSLGTLDRREGDLASARERYGKVLAIDKTNPSALRAMGILDMLEGNMELGLAEARQAYQVNPDYTYVRETYMIALALSGDEAKSREIEEEIKASGEVLEDDTYQLLAGEITLQDYYIGE